MMHTSSASQLPPTESEAEARICVFDPSLIYTVTVERGAGEEPEVHFHAGGQGFWVARMATSLGMATTLCTPFGGESGHVLSALIGAAHIDVRAVPCRGWNGGYIHDRRGGEREVIAEVRSEPLSRHEIDDLYNTTLVCGLRSKVTVLTGPAHDAVVPAQFYRRLAHDLGHNGSLVVADLANAALAEALEGGVYLLKVSDREIVEAGYAKENSVEALIDGLEQLYQQGAQNVVVSRAHHPALALVEQQRFEVISPRFEPMDAHGAGDSMTAALAVGIARGMDMTENLRFAAAAGALNVTRHGLGTGQRQNIAEVAARVQVKALNT